MYGTYFWISPALDNVCDVLRICCFVKPSTYGHWTKRLHGSEHLRISFGSTSFRTMTSNDDASPLCLLCLQSDNNWRQLILLLLIRATSLVSEPCNAPDASSQGKQNQCILYSNSLALFCSLIPSIRQRACLPTKIRFQQRRRHLGRTLAHPQGKVIAIECDITDNR